MEGLRSVVQGIGDAYVWLALKLGSTFIADVLKTLIGTFVGAGLAFYFAIRKDDLNRLREQKAAGNMATLTLVQLSNDFLLAKTELIEFQKYLHCVQPNSPMWMQFKPMHFTFADVKFDLPSLIFLLEHEGGNDVIPDFSSVMLWSPISTRGDRTNEEALFGRADHRVSAGG